jgi:hypothetical protein
MNAGDPFPLALEASKNVVVAVGASEPHRIGRDGTYESAKSDPRFTRYRRVAEPKACRFCMMLASRGAVYLSESSAGGAKKFHSHCRCHVEAVTSEAARRASRDAGAKDWAAMDQPKSTGIRLQPVDRAASVAQQLSVLRRQIGDGTATQWTRDRIRVLEAEQAA